MILCPMRGAADYRLHYPMNILVMLKYEYISFTSKIK